VRVFCFPYAGGGASIFAHWSEHLPEEIEINAIQLPGHETRVGDAPHTELSSLLDEVVRAVYPYFSKPFALFGHSMGALISFELARRIRREFAIQPAWLFLSGLRALQIPNPDQPLHSLNRVDFLQQLQSRYGMPANLVQHSELLDLFMPLLQANFQMCETYVYHPEPPFDCPISAFGGREDQRISPLDLAPWQAHTTKPLRLRILEGNHYFFEHFWSEIVSFVSRDLSECIPPR
jgi:medium-chain acyl-[acyl-carrier-protein] hydrolase